MIKYISMNDNNNFDFAIVGGGLAGSVLFNTLINNNKKVLLIDNSPKTSSSLVAAGLYNPIVFKRLTKSWNIDYLLEDLNQFYDVFDAKNRVNTHFKTNIFKIIANEDEKEFWLKKSKEKDLSNYLNFNIVRKFDDLLQYNSGLGRIYNSGYVNVKSFIYNTLNKAIINNQYYNELFDYNSLIIKKDNEYSYKNYCFNNIIFAEGYQAQKNIFFDKIKFKLTKGEILIIDIIDLKDLDKNNEISNYILNKNLFLLPFYDYNYDKILFKVGATYEWDDINENISEKGKIELLEKLEKTFKFKYNIIDHQVGIRPTIIDRRPVIGHHSKFKNMYIFNGLGTKGVMIAPYLANLLFYNYFTKEKKVDLNIKYNFNDEINYNRFIK